MFSFKSIHIIIIFYSFTYSNISGCIHIFFSLSKIKWIKEILQPNYNNSLENWSVGRGFREQKFILLDHLFPDIGMHGQHIRDRSCNPCRCTSRGGSCETCSQPAVDPESWWIYRHHLQAISLFPAWQIEVHKEPLENPHYSSFFTKRECETYCLEPELSLNELLYKSSFVEVLVSHNLFKSHSKALQVMIEVLQGASKLKLWH